MAMIKQHRSQISQAIGLEGAPMRDFVAINLLIIGLGTLLNGLTTRISAGPISKVLGMLLGRKTTE